MRSHVDHRGSGRRGRGADGFFKKKLADITRPGIAGQLKDPEAHTVRVTQRAIWPFLEAYHRPEVRGLDRVPDEPSMLVGHHDGGYIPVDGIVLGSAWHARFQFERPLIWLMHDFPFRLSEKLTDFLSRCGCRPASRASMQYAFERKQSLFVYPGGAWEAFRPYRKRREIDLGKRTGFVAESLRHRVPIVPIVSVGAHETLFVLARGNTLTRWLSPVFKKFRSDVAPLWLGLPWGIGFGPLPHLPLPAQITVEALDPIRLWEELGPDVAPDDPLVRQTGLDMVRGRMQTALDRLYAARRYPIIG